MPKSLKLYIAGVVTLSAVALGVTTLLIHARDAIAISVPAGSTIPHEVLTLAGIVFWMLLTLVASALPVTMPRGTIVGVSIAPIVAAMSLGGPIVAGWVAALGTTELRELRGKVPWYGSLANHAGMVLPAIVGGAVLEWTRGAIAGPSGDFVATMVGAAVFFALNVWITSSLIALRSGQSFRVVFFGDAGGFSL